MVDAVVRGRDSGGAFQDSAVPVAMAWLMLLGLPLFAAVLLQWPLRAPIGPMYWDTYTYYDAIGRMFAGQMPTRDFFTPAGPLSYSAAALFVWLFPNGQPTLLLHWSTLLFSLPLMALVVAGLPREQRSIAPWLVLPFALFSLLPFNGKEYYPFPGSDGFAFYNRQTCIVLFPLIAGLVFLRQRAMLCAVITLAMLVLFFLKITGFVAAGLICVFALLAGRIRFVDAALSAVAFGVVLGVVEVAGGLVSGYLADIVLLVTMNSGSLLPRVLQALSINFGVVAALVGLVFVLILADGEELLSDVRRLIDERSSEALAVVADRPSLWLATVTLAGLAFETQNTASQAMIFVWPVLLWTLIDQRAAFRGNRTALAVVLLAGAVYLPLVVNVIERTARAYVGATANLPLVHRNLGTLGQVNARPQFMMRAETMAAVYPRHRSTFDDLARQGEMAAPLLYSDFDFQILHLKELDKAIDAIRALEAQRGARFETLLAVDFTNTLHFLLQRKAPVGLTVGSDPFRTVPPLDERARRAVEAVDLALMPTCPLTPANLVLNQHFAAPLAQHRRVPLTACYEGLLHPRFQ